MVIDDMHLDRFIARHVITQYGFSEDVILMESATEALSYLLSKEHTPSELPSIIFLDIQMPEMDGFDFLDQFSSMSDAITTNCAIVMLTSSVDPRDFKKVTQQKYVAHYISKPLDKEKLESVTLILDTSERRKE